MSEDDARQLISQLKSDHPIALICETLTLSRASYYSKQHHQPSQRELENKHLLSAIRRIHRDSREIYGAAKIHQALLTEGKAVSVKRVQRLMKQGGICSKIVKKWRPQGAKKAVISRKNLLHQDFTTGALNEKWGADITYIYTKREGWTYLSSIQDLHSKKIIAWDLSQRMTDSLVVKSLRKALAQRPLKAGHTLTVQTDLGSQYTSHAFESLLKAHQIRHSYSRKGTPYDNAGIESCHATLKKEEVYQTSYSSFEEAKLALFKYIEGFYNQRRIHSSIGYLTPNEAEGLASDSQRNQ